MSAALYDIDYRHATITEHRGRDTCVGRVVRVEPDMQAGLITLWWSGPRGNLRRAVLVFADWDIEYRDGQAVFQKAANPQPNYHGHATPNVTGYMIALAP